MAGLTYTNQYESLLPGQPNPYAVANDPALQQAQAIGQGRALAGQLAVGLIPGAFQAGAMAIPTAMDIHNREQLKELERLRDAGRLGLNDQERGVMQRGLVDPVRALASEARMRTEGMVSAHGDQSSAADIVRARRQEHRDVNSAMQMANLQIENANLVRAKEQLRELEERKAAVGQRQAAALNMVGQTAAGIAAPLGNAMAAQATPQVDVQGLLDQGVDPKDILALVQSYQRHPGQRDVLSDVLVGGGRSNVPQ